MESVRQTVPEDARKSSPERQLLERVKPGASAINGCAYCVDMHTKDAHMHAEPEQQMHAVAVWSEAPYISERAEARERRECSH